MLERFLSRGARLHRRRVCFLCLADSREGPLCGACASTLPRPSGPLCQRCAAPAGGSRTCARCRAAQPAFESTIAAYEYRFPVDRMIHALKYGRRLGLVAWCAEAIAEAVAAARTPSLPPPVLVPVPPTRERLAERGFDQAAEIARALARHTGLPCLALACHRRGRQEAQAALHRRARERNVAHAFVCEAGVAGRAVAIVDDVMTTGASADALARALREAGAARVEAWVVARTPPPPGVA